MTTADITYQQICGYLDAASTYYNGIPEDRSVLARFNLPRTEVGMWIKVNEGPPFVGVSTRVPLVVPEPQRPQAAETVVRANYGLALGRFDFDMSTGNLFFRMGMPTAEDGIAEEQFKALVECSLWTVDRYFRAFGRLLFGDDLSPAEVIAEVEMAK